MTDDDKGTPALHSPIHNLRITFWGVQGSCPIFPSAHEVREYAKQVALHTLAQTGDDLAQKFERGELTADTLRALTQPESAEAYQQQIGLPDLPVYGGDTTCIEVETGDGDMLVFDAGTGVRDFSLRLLSRWANRKERVLHLFGTHEHLDHRSGLPFAAFCFARENPFEVNVYGPTRFLRALDDRYGLYSRRVVDGMHLDDPIDYRIMAAAFTGTELHNGSTKPEVKPPWQVRDISEPVRIGRTTITAFEVYHANTECLAYKICHGDAKFVFCTDHELRHGDNPTDRRQQSSLAAEERLSEHCEGADVAYFDGQYFLSEYLGLKPIGNSPATSRLDWGHSCVEDCIARARRGTIKRVFIGHHDPERHWDERVQIDRALANLSLPNGCRVQLARADQMIDI